VALHSKYTRALTLRMSEEAVDLCLSYAATQDAAAAADALALKARAEWERLVQNSPGVTIDDITALVVFLP
jgi:hypothetical protein